MKSYFRFLSRNKLYTLINIAGLVVSLMFIILMGDYTWRQSAIDSWHKNADRIYLTGNEKMFYMWPLAAEEIKNQCPEVSNQNKNRAESISFWLDFARNCGILGEIYLYLYSFGPKFLCTFGFFVYICKRKEKCNTTHPIFM